MEKKQNTFVRILIIALGLFIISLVAYNFFIIEPKGNISNQLIILISLLLILSLSEVFDSFSLGQFLTLKKEVKSKKEEVTELKEERKSLLNLLINNISIQNQSQNVGISPSELKDIITVIQADPNRVKEEDEEKEKQAEENESKSNKNSDSPRKRIDFRAVEEFGFRKFIGLNNLDKFEFKSQIQISSNDPISSRTPIYDGYLKTDHAEIFVEIKPQRLSMIFEGLYHRLNNVYHYQKIKKSNSYLQLILIEFPEDEENGRVRGMQEKIERDFAPSIDNGFLKIQYFKLTNEETETLYK